MATTNDQPVSITPEDDAAYDVCRRVLAEPTGFSTSDVLLAATLRELTWLRAKMMETADGVKAVSEGLSGGLGGMLGGLFGGNGGGAQAAEVVRVDVGGCDDDDQPQ